MFNFIRIFVGVYNADIHFGYFFFVFYSLIDCLKTINPFVSL